MTDSTTPPPLLVGLDIGGTSTHGALFQNGRCATEALGPSANVQNTGPEQAVAALVEVLERLSPSPGTPVLVGSGGVDTTEDAAVTAALVRNARPGLGEVRVLHDTRLLLAAGGTHVGTAVIAGTGSAAWGTDGQGSVRAGGWGHLLGDEGSGYWLGREAVRHALARMDRGEEPDPLTRALLTRWDARGPADLIRLFHVEHSRTAWAGCAAEVFDLELQEDQAASAMVDRAAAALVDLAAVLADRLPSLREQPVVLGGGLGQHRPALLDRVRAGAAERGLGKVVPLSVDPVHGAPLAWASNLR